MMLYEYTLGPKYTVENSRLVREVDYFCTEHRIFALVQAPERKMISYFFSL